MSDLTITAANVLASVNAQKAAGVAGPGVTITAGESVYKIANTSPQQFGLSKLDSGSSAAANTFAGIALNGASPGQPVWIAVTDPALVMGANGAIGDTVYASAANAGKVTSTLADLSTTGDVVICLGVVTTASAGAAAVLNLNPTVGGPHA